MKKLDGTPAFRMFLETSILVPRRLTGQHLQFRAAREARWLDNRAQSCVQKWYGGKSLGMVIKTLFLSHAFILLDRIRQLWVGGLGGFQL